MNDQSTLSSVEPSSSAFRLHPSSFEAARGLLRRLHDPLRSRRVGVLHVGARWLRDADNLAARLSEWNAVPFDYAAHLRAEYADAPRFVAISAASLETHLASLARAGAGGTALILNFDLALCFLAAEARDELWRNLDEHFAKSERALLLCLPERSPLGPSGQTAEVWQCAGRLATLE